MLTQEFKDHCARVVRSRFLTWQSRSSLAKIPGYTPDRMCTVWAAFGFHELSRHAGLKVMPQGGSCFWPVVRPEYDDGVSPNRYGFEFEMAETMRYLAMGQLPECHAWLAFEFDGVMHVVDFAAGSFARMGAVALGLKPEAVADVPEVFWYSAADDLPHGVEYRAVAEATEIVMRYGAKAMRM